MSTSSETVGFPIYGAAYDPDRQLIYVVGGGGSSKSGVKNLLVLSRRNCNFANLIGGLQIDSRGF